MFNYVAKFNLTDEIKEESFDEAVDYLQEDEEIQAGFEENIVQHCKHLQAGFQYGENTNDQ